MEKYNIDDEIFKFAYTMAFRDATARKAFKKLNMDDVAFRQKKKDIKDASMRKVKTYIDRICAGEVREFSALTDVILSVCDENHNFTFGNAQKLVNMTAKYMYLISYGDPNKRKVFKFCHCPMDGTMIRIVKEKYPKVNIKSDCSWSTLRYKDDSIPKEYEEFQKYIQTMVDEENQNRKDKDLIPLDMDYIFWDK